MASLAEIRAKLKEQENRAVVTQTLVAVITQCTHFGI